jgi:hypothetical protein
MKYQRQHKKIFLAKIPKTQFAHLIVREYTGFMKKIFKRIPLIAIIFPPIGIILFYRWLLKALLKKEKGDE